MLIINAGSRRNAEALMMKAFIRSFTIYTCTVTDKIFKAVSNIYKPDFLNHRKMYYKTGRQQQVLGQLQMLLIPAVTI